MIFTDYMAEIAARMKEPDAALVNVRATAGIPYYTKDELQHVVTMSLNQVVREVDPMDWDSFTSDAVQVLTGGAPAGGLPAGWSTLAIPTNFLRVLAASIDGAECVQSSVAGFFQLVGVSARRTSTFALFQGAVWFKGTSITLTILVEPTMDSWVAAQKPILPPGYDIRAVDIMAKRILISDYVPEWRA